MSCFLKYRQFAIVIFGVLSILSSGASADEIGPNVGGGGRSVLMDAQSVRNYIYQNCSRWDSATLKKAGIACEDLRAKMDEVGLSEERFKIEDKVIRRVIRNGRIADEEFDGWNHCEAPDNSDITFSISRWPPDSDVVRKIGFVTHEFLGCMHIEPTDDYHVTSELVMELRQKLGPEFQIQPDTVTFELVGLKMAWVDDVQHVYGIDSKNRRRFDLHIQLDPKSPFCQDKCKDKGTFTYITSRDIPLKTQYIAVTNLQLLVREFQRASAGCPIRLTIDVATGALLSHKSICGLEE